MIDDKILLSTMLAAKFLYIVLCDYRALPVYKKHEQQIIVDDLERAFKDFDEIRTSFDEEVERCGGLKETLPPTEDEIRDWEDEYAARDWEAQQ